MTFDTFANELLEMICTYLPSGDHIALISLNWRFRELFSERSKTIIMKKKKTERSVAIGKLYQIYADASGFEYIAYRTLDNNITYGFDLFADHHSMGENRIRLDKDGLPSSKMMITEVKKVVSDIFPNRTKVVLFESELLTRNQFINLLAKISDRINWNSKLFK